MQSLTRDWEKLSAKATSNHEKITQDLDRLISDLESLKDLIQRGTSVFYSKPLPSYAKPLPSYEAQSPQDVLELAHDLLFLNTPDSGSQIQGFQITQNNSLQPILNRSKTACKTAVQSHKELHSLSSRWIKMIDKKFNQTVLPLLGTNLVPPSQQAHASKPKQPFQSEDAQWALKRVITDHLIRQFRFETAHIFSQESQVPLSSHILESCRELYNIINSIQAGDLESAFKWTKSNEDWLNARESPLEFDLHRSQFVRILTQPAFDYPSHTTVNLPLSSSECDINFKMKIRTEEESTMQEDPSMIHDQASPSINHQNELPKIIEPDSNCMELDENHIVQEAYSKSREKALDYGRQNFPKFFPKRWDEAVKLTASSLYTPFSKLKQSPYSELYRSSVPKHNDNSHNQEADGLPWLHADHLIPSLIKEFCARLGWSKDLPLVVATELGSGGALAKIAKVRSVMKEKRTEWSQANELPVEIPLPVEYRFHSVFACPVSKEQSTELNPPMMMPCGHVIAKESMQKLAKGGGTVKCPYCPSSSSITSAIQVYF